MCDVTLAYPEGGEVKDDLLLNQRVNGWRALGPHQADRLAGAHPMMHECAGQHGAGPPLSRVAVHGNGATMIAMIEKGHELLNLLNGWSTVVWNRKMEVADAEAANESFIQRPFGHGDDCADPLNPQEDEVLL